MKIDHIAESLPMREYSDPLSDDDKEFLKSWNRADLIPDEDTDEASEPTDNAPEPDEDTPYSEWTGDQLRAELKKRELPTSGKVADLVARLEEDDEDDEDEDES